MTVLVGCGWVPSGEALGNGVTVAVGSGVACKGVTVAVGRGPGGTVAFGSGSACADKSRVSKQNRTELSNREKVVIVLMARSTRAFLRLAGPWKTAAPLSLRRDGNGENFATAD